MNNYPFLRIELSIIHRFYNRCWYDLRLNVIKLRPLQVRRMVYHSNARTKIVNTVRRTFRSRNDIDLRLTVSALDSD